MNQALDIDLISEKSGLVAADWARRLPHQAVPFTSTILFVVRKGNPKQIRDWDDLVKPGVVPIIPNPKTSGNGRYSYLAAWVYALGKAKGDEAAARAFVGRLFKAVPVLDSGGRAATSTFGQRGIGDVLLTFENEAQLALADFPGSGLSVVVPSVSILAESPVAVVDQNAAKHGTTAVANGYLQFLFEPEAQEIGARHFFRPVDPKIAAKHADRFPPPAGPGLRARRMGGRSEETLRRRRGLRSVLLAKLRRSAHGKNSCRLVLPKRLPAVDSRSWLAMSARSRLTPSVLSGSVAGSSRTVICRSFWES